MSARVLAVWCPDWPAVAAAAAADLPATRPVAVFLANRVIACSAQARAEGVQRGLRRREAQARCPELHVAQSDPERDARLFESVAAAVDEAAPGVEVLRPGLLVLAARGAVRYFGSEEAAAERIVDAVAAAGAECQIGIADELSTAVIAARRAALVPAGGGARFLAPLPIAEIAAEPSLSAPDRTDLVDLLRRLGLRTVGAFAALSRWMWRRGSGPTPSVRTGPRAVSRSGRRRRGRCPGSRGGTAVRPADREGRRGGLRGAGAGGTVARQTLGRVGRVYPVAGVGEHRQRRASEPDVALCRTVTPEGTADRVRWQLDGWLTGRSDSRPTAGITVLSLEPVEVVAAGALQLGCGAGSVRRTSGRGGRWSGYRACSVARRFRWGCSVAEGGRWTELHWCRWGTSWLPRRSVGAVAGPDARAGRRRRCCRTSRGVARGPLGSSGARDRAGRVGCGAHTAALGESGLGCAGLGGAVVGRRAMVGRVGGAGGVPGAGSARRFAGLASDLRERRWGVEGIYE